MDKCGHHNNRHYYFPVKIAIYYNFILNFCHNYTDKEGPVMDNSNKRGTNYSISLRDTLTSSL